MLKKTLIVLLLLATLGGGVYFAAKQMQKSATSVTDEKPVATQESSTALEDKVFSYTKDNLKSGCNEESKMICDVDLAIKCTINPDFEECASSKLPRFIFMSDEGLNRPTEMSFKIHKIKPIATDLIEIHTNSTCNGNWFGLCQGRVIYVLVPQEDSWRVKDIYAIESN